jgi:hypothetical protein
MVEIESIKPICLKKISKVDLIYIFLIYCVAHLDERLVGNPSAESENTLSSSKIGI